MVLTAVRHAVEFTRDHRYYALFRQRSIRNILRSSFGDVAGIIAEYDDGQAVLRCVHNDRAHEFWVSAAAPFDLPHSGYGEDAPYAPGTRGSVSAGTARESSGDIPVNDTTLSSATLYATAAADNTCKIWAVWTQGAVCCIATLNLSSALLSVATTVSTDGRVLLAVGSEDGDVTAWELHFDLDTSLAQQRQEQKQRRESIATTLSVCRVSHRWSMPVSGAVKHLTFLHGLNTPSKALLVGGTEHGEIHLWCISLPARPELSPPCSPVKADTAEVTTTGSIPCFLNVLFNRSHETPAAQPELTTLSAGAMVQLSLVGTPVVLEEGESLEDWEDDDADPLSVLDATPAPEQRKDPKKPVGTSIGTLGPVCTVRAHAGSVSGLVPVRGQDPLVFASSGRDGTVRLYFVTLEKDTGVITCHQMASLPCGGPVLCLASSHTRPVLYAGRRHDILRVQARNLDLSQGTVIETHQRQGVITSLAVGRGCEVLYCGLSNAVVQAWDVGHIKGRALLPRRLLQARAHRRSAAISCLALLQSGLLISGGSDYRVCIWE